MLVGDNSRYYASGVNWPGQAQGKWGTDADGQCSFVATFGSYTTATIDEVGRRFRRTWLHSVNSAYWKVSEMPGQYLYMSYDSVDVVMQISKTEAKEANQYWLNLPVLRFTPMP